MRSRSSEDPSGIDHVARELLPVELGLPAVDEVSVALVAIEIEAPGILLPCIVTELALLGDGMESPPLLPGTNVEGPNVTWGRSHVPPAIRDG